VTGQKSQGSQGIAEGGRNHSLSRFRSPPAGLTALVERTDSFLWVPNAKTMEAVLLHMIPMVHCVCVQSSAVMSMMNDRISMSCARRIVGVGMRPAWDGRREWNQ
jgi:hypothetical protein